jgi:hypothetical protein
LSFLYRNKSIYEKIFIKKIIFENYNNKKMSNYPNFDDLNKEKYVSDQQTKNLDNSVNLTQVYF